MLKKPLLLVAFLFVGWPPVGQGAYLTGNELVDLCQAALEAMGAGATLSSRELAEAGQCIGYLEGVADMSWAAGPSAEPVVCLPPTLATAQLLGSVLAYARTHPFHSDLPAFGLVLSALEETFPCEQ